MFATMMESEWWGDCRSFRKVADGSTRFTVRYSSDSGSGVYSLRWWKPDIVFLRRVTNNVRSNVSILSWSYHSIEDFWTFVTGWNLWMVRSLSLVPGSREWYSRRCIVRYTSQTVVRSIQCTSDMAHRVFRWRGRMIVGTWPEGNWLGKEDV